ncbi:HlyC/CorC family transporter [Thiohalocapsa marina]|uniref:HlyC/CorC family transporter n=1 Tax=Thiohalocapsa marina TaxID=424902 RepID=A0A5M8FEQ6_9GAMM|nr:HlyC/CorC family transporter [Thiohalocapsa marina]KAA6182400.1 HlyC/CorC family transporter [Thiohalocapsa marina]
MQAFPVVELVSLIGLLVLSGFFSGSETALMTLNRYRLRHKADQGHRGAILARRLLDRPDRLIGLILLGNNFVNILASSLATVIALELGGEGAIAIAAGLLTLVILIFSEVTPKTLAALHPELIAYPAAYIYTPLLKLMQPVVWGVNLITNNLLRVLGIRPETEQGNALSREELRTVVNEAGAMIPERSRDMLLAILDLENATVEDIMIPRNEVEGIDLQDAEEDIVAAIKRTSYTRLPLFDGGIDNVVGIFHTRSAADVLMQRDQIKDHLRSVASKPYYVPEATRLYPQLINFQRTRQRVGLVVDEYGDFQGLITLADLLEEIVGEFTTDPADAYPEIHRADDGCLLIDCAISIRELNRAMRWNLPTRGPKTLNGLILDYLETIPQTGTSLMLCGHPLEIIQTDDTTVKTVRCQTQPA